MQNYRELLKRYEREELQGVISPLAASARLKFIEWLEKQAVEPLAPDGSLVVRNSAGVLFCAVCGTGLDVE